MLSDPTFCGLQTLQRLSRSCGYKDVSCQLLCSVSYSLYHRYVYHESHFVHINLIFKFSYIPCDFKLRAVDCSRSSDCKAFITLATILP